VFLVPSMVGTSDTIWFCRLHRALTETTRTALEWEGRRFDLSTADRRARASATLQAHLKRFAHPVLLNRLDAILRALGDDPDRPVDVGSPYRILSQSEILSMAASGLVDFGAHTRSHAILSGLNDESCRREIVDSVADVTRLTGRPCRLFAYPNGQPRNYNAHALAVLSACGVRGAVTTVAKGNDARTPALELGRYDVGAGITAAECRSGVHLCARRH
jgi:hypothetical protein